MTKIIIIILLIVIIFIIYIKENSTKELYSNCNYNLINADGKFNLKKKYNKEVRKNKLKDCTNKFKCIDKVNYDGNWKETQFYNYLKNTPLTYDGL